MRTTTRGIYIILISILFFTITQAQDTRAFNQNASRSNHGSALSIFISPLYSSATNSSSDSLLFRGSGSGFRVGGDYFFGNAGIGFSSGFSSSSPDDAAINSFIKGASVPPDQLQVTKSKQQNMYLLFGPSVRFGNKVELYAHAKGGLFINNSGLVSIQQKGAQRAAYRNESTDKNVYPGFLTGLNVQYKTKSDLWSFGVGVDYMKTKSEVNNYDARRNGGIEPLKLSGDINDIVAGVSVRYNIFSPRDHASGQASGKRVLPTVNKRELAAPRDHASGLATGKRSAPIDNNIAIDEPGMINAGQNCGPVTQKITRPDGTTEEMTFACPQDAADFAARDAGSGLATGKRSRDAGSGLATGKRSTDAMRTISNEPGTKGIISGRLSWVSTNTAMGIVTNRAIITNNTTRSGSATMNSQSSSTRTTNQSSFGTLVRFAARDAASGMATGKRSRDAASGLATGRRQYQPIYADGEGDVCNPCMAIAKMSGANTNPLYKDNGMQGSNPLYQGKERIMSGTDDDCDGVEGADIYLIDASSGSTVAKTITEKCGDFFFANVPEGNYVVRLSGIYSSKKGYDISLQSKTDLGGDITQADDWMQLVINTGNDNDDMAQKAGISTSRSNIRTKSISIIEADLDGDGEFESLKVLAVSNDGTSKDITANSRMSTTGQVKKVTVRGWDPEKKQGIAGSSNEFTITINDNNAVLLTSQSGGTKKETMATAKVSHHPNVVQFVIDLDEEAADARIKTKSNIKNDRVAAGDITGDGLGNAKITKSRSNIQNNRIAGNDPDDDGIWSPRSNIKMIRIAAGDVDGDGRADIIAGNNLRTEFAVLRDRLKDRFETGDVPTGQQRLIGGALPGGSVLSSTVSAMRPGSPIGGLSIKGGKNPGGNLRSIQTNENGEFEFPNLEPGDYTFTIEQRFVLDDETSVTVGNQMKAQDHNSSRSNKTASAIDADPGGGSTILDSKSNGKVLTEDQARNGIAFRWTPLVPKPKEPVTYRLRVWQLMQGQNGTQASTKNKPIVEKEMTDQTETSVEGILTGPCKPPYLCDFVWSVQAFSSDGKLISGSDLGGFSVRSQNNGTTRSNRNLKAIVIEADLDGDGEYESNVSNKLSDEITMDDEGNLGSPQQKAGVSTSRSNIRSRSGLVDKGDGIFVSYATASVDDKDVAVKIVYKSTHEMQMGAIRNLK